MDIAVLLELDLFQVSIYSAAACSKMLVFKLLY